MRNWILVFFLFLGSVLNAQQVTHHVEAGETLYGISRLYNVSVDAILQANPVLEEGLKEGQDIIIPNARVVDDVERLERDDSKFDYYTVSAGETVFSLTREWGIRYEDLLELNPELANGLQVDQVLTLPEGTLGERVDPRSEQGYIPYKVRAGQTIFSLVRSLEWTEQDLYAVNPEIRIEGLKAGSAIWIPDNETTQDWITEVEEAEIARTDSLVSLEMQIADSAIDTSEVEEPKDTSTAQEEREARYKVVKIEPGQEWPDVIRLYQTSKDELVRLNPELVNGLRANRFIIVPNVVESPELDSLSSVGLSWDRESLKSLLQDEKVKVAIALPLYLEENDSLALAYRVGDLAPRLYRRSQMGFEFYSGLKLAMDSLTSYGLDIEVSVYDTRNDLNRVRSITAEIVDEGDFDLVIGPLYSANAEEMARYAPEQWIVSPLSRRVNNQNRMHLVQAAAPISEEHLALANWVNEYAAEANLIFVRRDGEDEDRRVQGFLQHLEASEERNVEQMIMGEDMFNTWNVRSSLAAGKMDVFVVLDDDPVLMASFVNSAASIGDTNIALLTTSRLLRMNTLELEKLNRLNVYMSDAEYIDYSLEGTNLFLAKYREQMKTEPARFAFHGYDIGMYFLPIFALEYGPDAYPWMQGDGISKAYFFQDSPAHGPTNSGTVMLKLEDFVWVRINKR